MLALVTYALSIVSAPLMLDRDANLSPRPHQPQAFAANTLTLLICGRRPSSS